MPATVSNFALTLNKKKTGKKIKVALVGTGFAMGTKVEIRYPADTAQPAKALWTGDVTRVWAGDTRARAELTQTRDLDAKDLRDDTGTVSITVDAGTSAPSTITVTNVDLYEE